MTRDLIAVESDTKNAYSSSLPYKRLDDQFSHQVSSTFSKKIL